MKILRVIGGLDATFGGPSVSAVNSAIAAQRAGIETHMAFPARNVEEAMNFEAARRLQQAGVRLVCFAHSFGGGNLQRRYGISAPLAAWLRRHAAEYDLFHVHSPWGLPTLAGVLASSAVRRPVILTPHEGLTTFDMAHARVPVLRSMKRALKRFYAKKVDQIVFSSGLELQDSLSGLDANACRVIYHPVYDDLAAVQGSAQHAQTRDQREIRVGFLGRLVEKKNVDVVIAAVARLSPSVSLTIGGDGKEAYASMLRSRAEALGVADRISWLGFVQGAVKWQLLRDIDVLVMPSSYECFGMVAAEAMVVGTPVIVTPTTGVAEIVHRYGSGLVVDPTVEALTAGITTLSNNPVARSAYGDQGKRAATDTLSFTAHAKRLVGLYDELLTRAHASQ